MFDQYRRFASADDARVHALIIDAAEGTAGFFQNRSETFRNVLAQYMNLPREKRAYAAQQLLRVNRDAAIFVTQTLLRSAGYFSGEVNGVYAPETIDAIARACRAGGEGKCGPKTLHGDTIGFIARNLS